MAGSIPIFVTGQHAEPQRLDGWAGCQLPPPEAGGSLELGLHQAGGFPTLSSAFRTLVAWLLGQALGWHSFLKALEDNDHDFYFVSLELTRVSSSQKESPEHSLLKIPIVSNEYSNDMTIHVGIFVYNLPIDVGSLWKWYFIYF